MLLLLATLAGGLSLLIRLRRRLPTLLTALARLLSLLAGFLVALVLTGLLILLVAHGFSAFCRGAYQGVPRRSHLDIRWH